MIRNQPKWPILLLALDLLGAIIVAVGIMAFLDTGGVKAALLIASGLLLMLPLVLHILKRLPAKGNKTDKLDGER
jgi:hypothetical protein